jgi:aldose sugar dehydrogenase
MPKTLIHKFFSILAFLILNFSSSLAVAHDFKSSGMNLTVETLTTQSDVIWGFDFVDSSQIIFTLRSGDIKIITLGNKKVYKVSGAPTVWNRGQGGMLDIRVHPKDNRKIFFTYSEPAANDTATTVLATADIDNKTSLKNVKKIFSADSPNNNSIHFGSRIEFDDQDHLFVSVGDRNDRPSVQSTKTAIGKILRLNFDGSIPSDNPFAKVEGARKDIWSLGHRSPQGLSWHPAKKQLWEAEMGPQGGDEINLIKKGENYGWPVVTFGREYSGEKLGEGSEKAGMQAPVTYWVPSISPSGIAFYLADKLPQWKESLFVGCLSGSHLRRLTIEGDKVVAQEELLKDLNLRFRSMRTGPDGWFYFSTDQGHLMRIKIKG